MFLILHILFVYLHKIQSFVFFLILFFLFFIVILHSWSSVALQWNQMDSEVAVISSLEKSKSFFRFWLLACNRSTLKQAFAESYPSPSCSDLAGRCPLADGLHRYGFVCWPRVVTFVEKQGKSEERLINFYVLISRWVPVPERLKNNLFWDALCTYRVLFCVCTEKLVIFMICGWISELEVLFEIYNLLSL